MSRDTTHDSIDAQNSDGDATEEYGLLVVRRGEAAVGRLVDGRVVTDAAFDEGITGSARAGGGATDRFERERARQTRAFYERVGEAATAAFLGDGGPPDGIAVGGSTDTATAVLDGDYLEETLTDRIVGTYTVEHAGESALGDLVDAASDALLDAEARAVCEAVGEFFARLRDGERAVYGDEAVRQAAEAGAVDTALVAAGVDADRRDPIETAVAERGGETLVVPEGFDDGARFAETFEIGGLLRWPLA